jgi:hypothetical protein
VIEIHLCCNRPEKRRANRTLTFASMSLRAQPPEGHTARKCRCVIEAADCCGVVDTCMICHEMLKHFDANAFLNSKISAHFPRAQVRFVPLGQIGSAGEESVATPL